MSASNMDDTHQPQRPHSIDLSLELERQLALEDTESHPPTSPTHARHPSLDPSVIASIVAQLREDLERITKERDGLLNMVATHTATEADLKDTLAMVTDKYTAAQEELETAREKARDDQENISMLRAKVEESRRGLMKLQTESRRSSMMSTMTLDLGSARSGTFTAPTSARRPGFAPLTGTGTRHRRGQSVTEDGFVVPDLPKSLGTPAPTDGSRSRSPDRSSITSSPPRHSKRLSGFFGRTSPAAAVAEVEPSGALSPDPVAELERLRRELASTRDQLEETRHELTEANEAKEASETCAKALREFIADNGVGEGALPSAARPPPAPAPVQKQGWGFKLWRADSTVSTGSASSSTIPTAPKPTDATPTAAPLSQKMGGFFGARTSIASDDGASTRGPHAEEGSDISSADDLMEPVSPASEHPRGAVLIRNPSIASSAAGRPGLESSASKDGEAPASTGIALAL